MRNTGDWRLAANPARVSLLERIEYVRALKRSQNGLKALEFLARQQVNPATEWIRIALAGQYHPSVGFTVEEGNVFAPYAVAFEMKTPIPVEPLAGPDLLQAGVLIG